MRNGETLRKTQNEEIIDAELSEKERKKIQRKESVEKRRNARKRDKVARWGGLILLGLMMFVGFLLWVSGEMKTEIKPLDQKNITPLESQGESVIVR